MALPEERQAVEVEVAAHFQAKSRQEAQALVERALIKHLRRKFQIPYCSPYLY
jgi:hypothetical protein